MASWARQREHIREAVEAGSRARDTDDGSRVLGLRRGRGAYALLQRADGSVTRAGEAYFGMLGRQPESRTFDPRQPLVREGAADYVLLQNGQRGLVRRLREDGTYQLTNLGRRFFKNKYSQHVAHIAVVIRGMRRAGKNAGRAYERRDWLPANVLGGEEQQILQNVKQETLRLITAGDEDRAAGRAPIMELSDETYFYDPEGEWVVSSETTQYRNSRVHVETILRQRLRGLRRVSYQLPCFNNILECAFEDSGTTPACRGSGPELRLLGNQSARVFLERDGGAHQCELIMINDEALVQTKSLSTQLPLTTNQRNPGCLVIAGNTGNVVCNTSFTNLLDSRAKTEMAEADLGELLQLFDSVEAKQHKRPDMNGDLRLGFASDDFAGTKWKNLTGTARWRW